MERETLERAAMVLGKTDYSRVSGKVATAASLRQDIDSLYNSTVKAATDNVAMNFYRGFTEIIKPLQEQGLSLEQMLEYLLSQLKEMLGAHNVSGKNWVGPTPNSWTQS